MVFVGCNHPIYTEPDRKTPKRVGNLVKSSSASLHGMLMAHKEEVQKYIKGLVKSAEAERPTDEDPPPGLNEIDMMVDPGDYMGPAKRYHMEAEREASEARRHLHSMGLARY